MTTNEDNPVREPFEHDLTNPTWGSSAKITVWNPQEGHASGHCWLPRRPVDGDILIVRGKRGPIRLKLYNLRWVSSVDDMYEFHAVPEDAPIPEY